MKNQKYLLAFLIVSMSGCATSTPVITGEKNAKTLNTSKQNIPTPEVTPWNPLEPQEGESREHFLGRQIADLDKEISQLEPKVIASQNRMDPAGVNESSILKEKLFALERQKASFELQLLSLP